MSETMDGRTRDESIDLSAYDRQFSDAELQESDFEEIEDGKYQVRVDRVEIVRARTSGNLQLKWTLKVLAPRFEGRFLWRYNQFATRENLSWLKTDLHTCGLTVENLSTLPGHLDELLDITLEVTKKTKGEFSNIYFNRRIEIPEGTDGGTSGDIPF
ncbi:MAG: DUF669 domain-containing protein [Candidatus Eisenbacteria bacterium]